MSTYYYSCEKCGDELGSAQDILWLQEKPYHPECATERDRSGERDAAIAKLLEAAKDVCWFDWSLNDEDAVRSVNRLEQAIKEYVRLRDE